MNNYISGEVIKSLREKNKMTQQEMAEKIGVSDKTISKWETSRGLPDISMIEPIAKVLRVSIIELFSGICIENNNKSSNLMKGKMYVCPLCGNFIISNGDVVVSCCGISLPSLEVEEESSTHNIKVENIEDEIFVSIDHPMTKKHYISFIAYVKADKFEVQKLYPEGNAEARFKKKGVGKLYAYCNKDGLFSINK